MISAKVIADSVSPWGDRLTTMELNFHRFILSEFNTHRQFSRNSASSRAIPIEKQIAMIKEDPAIPVEFGRNQSGMQAGPPLEGAELNLAVAEWLVARDHAVESAENLLGLGVHKQVTNRILEPFMWHRVIVTSTEWDNFFGLRDNELAQPEIHVLASRMKEALGSSLPAELRVGEWHMPYIDEEDWGITQDEEYLCKISAARCARVSYLTHDGLRNHDKDYELFERLTSASPAHASPLEHVATPVRNSGGISAGNFNGYHQLRHLI